MKKLMVLAVPLIVAVIFISNTVYALGIYKSGTTGLDVSWPNCNARIGKVAFGIVGVTGGTVYRYNNCLKLEAGKFNNLSLYVNTGWYAQSTKYINPSSPKQCTLDDLYCLAYNYGYNAGLDAINYASSQGVKSSTWWLDVETENSWSDNYMQNRQSLQGEYDALNANGVTTIGAYSTTYQWNLITGEWKNGWPNWGASTWRTAKQAKTFCKGHEFTGGPTYLIQYLGVLDQDYAC